MKAASYDKNGFEIFNIGSGESYSVNEIVNKILSLTKLKATVVTYTIKTRDNEISNIVADITKA